MNALSSRLKIASMSAIISGVVLVAFGFSAWLVVSRQKLESLDTEIRSLGARHPGWIANRGNYERLDTALEFIFGEEHANQVILLVKDINGSVLHVSPGWPADLDPTHLDCQLTDDPNSIVVGAEPSAGLGRGRGGGGRGLGPGGGGVQATFTKIPRFQSAKTTNGAWRLGMLGTADTTLVIGLSQDQVHRELNHLWLAFMISLPIALVLVGLGGWVVAGRALRPLKIIAATAEHVTARGLEQRIPDTRESPEASRVILVLNRMMDRLEASFRQATRFSADASHELKTPLAIMQGELENALQSAAAGSPEQQLFSNLLEETQRLKTITRSLLLLAQADAGQLKLALEPVDLSAELEGMMEDAQTLATEHQLKFDVVVAPCQMISADRVLLHTALFNLITNAVKYNEPKGRVEVRLETTQDKYVFRVGNSGPGIPKEDQDRIFERFRRGAGVPSGDGLGLGLSLAREIIRAHGGELQLTESRLGWTCFEAVLQQPSNNLPASSKPVFTGCRQ